MLFKKNKCVQINKAEWHQILDISDDSTCLADCISKLQKAFNLDYDRAFNLAQAFRNNYKYMKVTEE